MNEFEPYKEKNNEVGMPFLYLLRSQTDKDVYSVVRIDNDVPILISGPFRKTSEELKQEDWENLTSRKRDIEQFLVLNMDTDELMNLENNFYQTDSPEELEKKTYLIDFFEADE